MENLLLRRLTFRSKIGFGYFKDLLVMDLYNLGKYKELVNMYYHLSKIDFNDEVKEALCITGDRVIPKPSKNEEFYYANKDEILKEIWKNHTIRTKGFDYTIQSEKYNKFRNEKS
jgi:hypothetical protein